MAVDVGIRIVGDAPGSGTTGTHPQVIVDNANAYYGSGSADAIYVKNNAYKLSHICHILIKFGGLSGDIMIDDWLLPSNPNSYDGFMYIDEPTFVHFLDILDELGLINYDYDGIHYYAKLLVTSNEREYRFNPDDSSLVGDDHCEYAKCQNMKHLPQYNFGYQCNCPQLQGCQTFDNLVFDNIILC